MDVNHRDETGSKLGTTQDMKWVLNRTSKLWIPPHTKQAKVSRERRIFSDKTLWDWLNLFGVLAIPFVVTIVGLYLTQQITEQQVQSSERQHQTDVQIAEDQQRATILKTCIDDIKDLLLNHNLLIPTSGDEVRIVARAEVLLTLRQLDGKRNGTLIRFLSEANLITSDGYNVIVISLSGADLGSVDLHGADLRGLNLSVADLSSADLNSADLRDAFLYDTNLSGADLRGAELHGTDLHGANLNDARAIHVDLSNADLNSADLSGANLSGAVVTNNQLVNAASLNGTIMPDGTIHP
jgi:hypothetical protein